MGFPCGSTGNESACNLRDLGSIPGLGRSVGKGKGYSFQYPGLENAMDIAKSQTRWSDFHFRYPRNTLVQVSEKNFKPHK